MLWGFRRGCTFNCKYSPLNQEVNLSDDGPIADNEGGIGVNLGESIKPPPPPPNLHSPLWLGRSFVSKGDFKDVVKTFAIQFGKELKFKKNDKIRCIATCTQDGCRWQVTCRKDPDEDFQKVTAFNDDHDNRPLLNENKLITSTLVTKRLKTHIARNSNWQMSEFREKVCTDDHHSLTVR